MAVGQTVIKMSIEEVFQVQVLSSAFSALFS